jgi:hypothetical protein
MGLEEEMRFVPPDKGDIADVSLAIRSIPGAWGSVDASGNYTPQLDQKTLWLMLKLDCQTCSALINDFAPPKYAEMFPKNLGNENGILHAQASKIRRGLFSAVWLLKITFILDDATYPIGFIAAPTQSSAWLSLQQLLNFSDSEHRFYLTAETAIGMIK